MENKRVYIKGLKEGRYCLNIDEADLDIYFNVIKGSKWEGTSLLYSETESKLYDLPDNEGNSVAFGEEKISSAGETITVEVPVSSGL